ncbi:MAG: tRNA (adenosine(37)-N6)-threonylcarbamoyltransferase complex ATPase subunit type 1 TsaE [Planctomycetaceae bacterium]|nr:tRNA (adenosine(37)-N6)-threonylcarbamoyltransferase complex ATPase subunit type 1 TsaE [Planctomycetaceae bacterium]
MSDAASHHPQQASFIATSEAETDRLGAWLAKALAPGDIVALQGDLGAGKTRLVRSIVASRSPQPQAVSSPTFVLMQRYDADVPIFHFDAYRLRDVEEFLELGVEEIFAEPGICLIEWAARVADALPARHLRIDIRVTGPETREFVLTGAHARSIAMIEDVRGRMANSGSSAAPFR